MFEIGQYKLKKKLIYTRFTEAYPSYIISGSSFFRKFEKTIPMKSLLFIASLFVLFISCNRKQNPNSPYTLIKGGSIIQPSKNSAILENGYILFKNNEILEIGSFSEKINIPDGAKIIDGSGKFIVPGLIDGFAVLNNQFYANAFLYSGVTTIIGVDGGRRGYFYPNANPSPDYYMLESVGDEIKSDEDHLKDLNQLYKDGYKIALLKYKLKPDQVELLCDSAKNLGMGTIGELGYTSYKKGGEAGINAFVHTTRYSLDIAPVKMRKAVANHPFSNDLNSPKWSYYKYLYQLDTADILLNQHAQTLAHSGVFLMPTLSLLYGDLPQHENPWNSPVAKILNPVDINNPLDKETGKHSYSEDIQKNYTTMGLQELKIENIYRTAGAKYLAGSATDVWGTMPGISLHTELQLLKRIGLGNEEVLASATSNFADAFGWKTGKLETGFEADILILDKNPIADLENLNTISTLINNGIIIHQEELLAIEHDENLPNGTVITRKDINVISDTSNFGFTQNPDESGTLLQQFRFLENIKLEELFYMSDGLRVKAILASPIKEGKHPVIIYNRGGNREFGKISPKKMVYNMAEMARWGYVVIGSQYRGNDGGDGQEEFGGADINDVISLLPLIKSQSNTNPDRIGMFGISRGGMMTYLSLMETDEIKAAAVIGGVTDLSLMNDSRGGVMEQYVYSQLIPNYWEHKDSLLKQRSAITRLDEISKTTPMLIMHGTSDWRVVPEESYNIAHEFQQRKIPYRLVMFEGADHGLSENREEAYNMIKSWFDKYLKNDEELPNLEPHGR